MIRRTSGVALNHVALVGTYVPRRCGIATFTKDLRDALTDVVGTESAFAIAMDDESSPLRYPDDVRFQVRSNQQQDYRVAAELLNINQVDVTIVQHEFGIYGGHDGSMLLTFLRRLRMPSICTLHTVVRQPSKNQEQVLREIADLSDRLVVMSRKGVEFLKTIYKIPEEKIEYIPHGIPDVPFVDPTFFKDQFGLEGRTVLLTFGLLSRNKGIEYMLEALPKVVKKHPDVMYVIQGATHPGVLRTEGDAYRNQLERFVEEKKLRDHVMFQNRFVTIEELCGYIGAADLYVTPYVNVEQITSGTLTYAMGAGKAVVSTPYWYAEEMLADGRGRLTPVRNAEALAEHVIALLDNPIERNSMRKNAYLFCRSMIWKEVARRYAEVATQIIEERRRKPRPLLPVAREMIAVETLPEINLKHLRMMTDDTGIYQHAIYTIPDRHHGYCTDDNARALVAALRYYGLTRDESILPLASTYLAFMHSAFNRSNGRFRNFMSFERRWLEEAGSEDCHARALWALGEAVALAPDDGVLGYTTRLFNDALKASDAFTHPRAWAFTLVGVHMYLRRFSGDTCARRVRDGLAHRLYDAFKKTATAEWPFCEDVVTYDNAELPHALLLSGQWLPAPEMTEQGLRTLRWLLDIQTNPNGHISLIGCDGWYRKGGDRAVFDQQPVEIMSLVDTCAEAYRATGHAQWGDEIRRCLDWFLGKNDVGAPLYDFRTGGCRDGLSPQGANQNEGAEATLAFLISLMTAYEITGSGKIENIWQGMTEVAPAASNAGFAPAMVVDRSTSQEPGREYNHES